MNEFLKEKKYELYHKMLQVEESAEIGWLLYSTREMDAGALADEMSDILGMQVGLCWKVIDTVNKGKLSASQKVMSLTVEVEKSIRWESQRKFLKYFGRTPKKTSEYPNGIRLRFVKYKKDAITTLEKTRIDRLRTRQKHFLASIKKSQTWDIEQLDYANPDSDDLTLRQMIMDIKSVKFPSIPLFHCVDLNWQGNGYIFQYCPNMEEEAEVMMQILLPYLRYMVPDCPSHEYFTSEYNARCETLKWDPIRNEVVDTEMEEEENDIDADDDVLIGFSLDIVNNSNEDEEMRPDKQHHTPSPYDEDSVPSLRTTSNTPSNRFNPIATPASSTRTKYSGNTPTTFTTADESSSVYSSTSTITMETITTINNRLDAMAAKLSNTDNQFAQIMQTLNGHMTSTPAYTARPPTVGSSIGSPKAPGGLRK